MLKAAFAIFVGVLAIYALFKLLGMIKTDTTKSEDDTFTNYPWF